MRLQFFRTICAITALLACCTSAIAEKPRLVVNIVVGSLSNSDLDRFSSNFSDGGFKRLMEGGVRYHNAMLDYANTSTAAGLATIATGTEPATHGVVGDYWWNYVDGSYMELIFDDKAQSVAPSTGTGKYSPHRLNSPTIGDMLIMHDNQSKSCTIAIDPTSAIVLTGKHGVGYWAEKKQTHWTTSSAYTQTLPKWIAEYNRENQNDIYHMKRWRPLYTAQHYTNSEVAVMEGITSKSTTLIKGIDLTLANSDFGKMCYTPAGNSMLLKFAFQYITKESLGKDEHPDIITISLDTARYIAQTYGTESMEYEDMLYRLDKELCWFIDSVYTNVQPSGSVVIVLSSDHGTSPSYNMHGSEPRFRFNTRQMEVIVNAYLGGRYGTDDYVVGYANNGLYLNHATLAAKRLDYADICDEVATFLLQLQGISTAISATSMRNTSYIDGRSALMWRSYFGARSGDVLIDLVPGCIIEDDDRRSLSSSGYIHDRHTPLIISQQGMTQRSVYRKVDMRELAPTLCHIMGVSRPWASTEQAVQEF